jgi:hypothetical protein
MKKHLKSLQSFKQNIKIDHNIHRKLDQRLMLMDDSHKKIRCHPLFHGCSHPLTGELDR